jgi:fructokinase
MEKHNTHKSTTDQHTSLPHLCPQLNIPIQPTTILGTGLLTLDIVINGGEQQAPRLWAGGTCGNVLTIMSFLGWQSYPIARLNGDAASRYVQSDLKKWGVKLRYAKQQPTTDTPIIVHQIKHNRAGQPSHKFSWQCPHCGAWLPTYRAITNEAAQEIVEEATQPQVFYFDRVSRGALTIAQACAADSALIVFEPSATGDPKLMREAFALAHIVKYASDRAAGFSELLPAITPLVEIETRGNEGLRYRCRLSRHKITKWRHIAAYPVMNLKDAAGSGDWCTAGILHLIAQQGMEGLKSLTADKLQEALRLGQALAAWNCGFEGARGGMYSVTKPAFRSAISQILSNRLPQQNDKQPIQQKLHESLCPTCHSYPLPTARLAGHR